MTPSAALDGQLEEQRLRYEALLAEERARNATATARITALENQLATVTSGNQQREQQLAEERAKHGICKEQLAAAKEEKKELELVTDALKERLNEVSREESKEELRVAQQQITSLEANLSLMRETNQSLEHQMTRLAGDLAIYRGDVALIDSLSSSRVKDLAADLAHTAELVAKRKVSSN